MGEESAPGSSLERKPREGGLWKAEHIGSSLGLRPVSAFASKGLRLHCGKVSLGFGPCAEVCQAVVCMPWPRSFAERLRKAREDGVSPHSQLSQPPWPRCTSGVRCRSASATPALI